MEFHPYEVAPGQPFNVWYFIRNHTDSTTYYVRARIYDVTTGELLSTVDLSQASTNSRLFITTTQSPPDPSGYGRAIVAIATVYTDSGHTTRSQDYEEEEQYFLVKSTPPLLGGGGGVDYRILRDIIQEEIGKAPKPSPVQAPDLSFVQPLFGTLGVLQRELNRVPKDAANLTAIEKAIADVRDTITNLPPPEKQNLAPLAKSLDRTASEIVGIRTEIAKGNQLIAGRLLALQSVMEKLSPDIISKIDQAMQNVEVAFPSAKMPLTAKPQEAASTSFNIRSLTTA